ncbi:hypothetical protein RB596_001307 [Gaeumannomyces avenae]
MPAPGTRSAQNISSLAPQYPSGLELDEADSYEAIESSLVYVDRIVTPQPLEPYQFFFGSPFGSFESLTLRGGDGKPRASSAPWATGLTGGGQCDTAVDEGSADRCLQAVRSASSSYPSEGLRVSPELPSPPSASMRNRWFSSLTRFGKPGGHLSSLFRSSSSSAACRPGREGTSSDECARAETDTVTTVESLQDGPHGVPLEKVQVRHQHETQQIESPEPGQETPCATAAKDVFTVSLRERPTPSIRDSVFDGLEDAISVSGSSLLTLSDISFASIRCNPRQSDDPMADEPMALARYRRKTHRETSPDLDTTRTTLWRQMMGKERVPWYRRWSRRFKDAQRPVSQTRDGPRPKGDQISTVVSAKTRRPLSSTRNSGEQVQQPLFSGASSEHAASIEEEQQTSEGGQAPSESLSVVNECPEDVAEPTQADSHTTESPGLPQDNLPDTQSQPELPAEAETLSLSPTMVPVETLIETQAHDGEDTEARPLPEPLYTLEDVIQSLSQTPARAERHSSPQGEPRTISRQEVLEQQDGEAQGQTTVDSSPDDRSYSEEVSDSASGATICQGFGISDEDPEIASDYALAA